MEQSRIRPDAPWLQFLDARYRLLLAYQSLEKIRRLVPGADPGAAADDPLRSAFLQLTHALDRVTVPLEYWSERPHENLEGEEKHAAMLGALSDLAAGLSDLSGQPNDAEREERMLRIMGDHIRFLRPEPTVPPGASPSSSPPLLPSSPSEYQEA
ncbi:hypothetical protein JCM8202_002587 [Rhodotorula sphaerocarpa]